MEKNMTCTQPTESEINLDEQKPKFKENLKKILLTGGVVLLIGAGIAWKCWDGQKIDLKKLPTDELNNLRNKLHEIVLSPSSDQESKIDCRKWIEIIDNIIRARNPVDTKNYIYPKGGDHGNLLWKPD